MPIELTGGADIRSAISERTATYLIAVAQLFGTSLWFSANGAMGDLQLHWELSASAIGWLTNSVQVGFIAGTLLFALSGYADRFAAYRIFAVCSATGALANLVFALAASSFSQALAARFVVGLCLAGVYPIGMKLMVLCAPSKAAQSLALLVGMLTLGTASVHGIRAVFWGLPWQVSVLSSSALAIAGAVIVLMLGSKQSPTRPTGQSVSRSRARASDVFRIPEFRAAAFGYFGHMWELYAFWTLTPLLIRHALVGFAFSAEQISALSFAVIAIGCMGCLIAGATSRKTGSAITAGVALGISGSICAAYPWVAQLGPAVQLTVLLVWGLAVVADSPQFSALSVRAAPGSSIGGALAIQNSIGFLLSSCSIAIATSAFETIGPLVSWILLPGPIIGLWAMRTLFTKKW